MRYRLQRHDGTDCSATMVPITVLRMVPIQRYRHKFDYVHRLLIKKIVIFFCIFITKKREKGFQAISYLTKII